MNRQLFRKITNRQLAPLGPVPLQHAAKSTSTNAAGALATSMRTHTCGDLDATNIDQQVRLCGWVQNIRVLSDTLVFVQLRDAYGTMQLLAEQSKIPQFKEQKRLLEQLNTDSLIKVVGKVVRRPEGMAKTTAQTGEIELLVDQIQVLNSAEPLPFNPHVKNKLPGEDTRLTHRYLDLRRPELQHNIRVRSKATMAIRQFMDDNSKLAAIDYKSL
ncbi:aspartate--tRNA ligase msd1 [Kickxella alabastrina]|uniref:Aspartate--tRNA ligase msd1 n=1 Tax=Kickxella alabastrina TaxID=61397 RepID=A0ACC1IQN9_9FUNG|nr:aspartate--tRNA ligase msd1 [Kickxella alabastrina]